MQKIVCITGFLFCSMIFAQSQSHRETNVTNYFESIKKAPTPEKLRTFLQAMPKGGDLHNHLTGATYAENMFRYAKNDNLCIDRKTYAVSENAECEPNDRLISAIRKFNFYNKVIDAWSMRNFSEKTQSGHDHFFDVFPKINTLVKKHQGDILAEVTKRAAVHNESYLELMLTTDSGASGQLGKKVGWDPDFKVMQAKLLAQKDESGNNQFQEIIKSSEKFLSNIEETKEGILACRSHFPDPGCKVKVRYLYQVNRGQNPEMVFSQLLAGFQIAQQDKRVVGLNIVQPEDGPISMRDYRLQMQMFAWFHQQYPEVTYSLHAGELNDRLVPEEGLTFHIHDAIFVANANRIGHGVDIANEYGLEKILKAMSDRDIPVEINISSNAHILNIEGVDHPLPLYMQHEIPLTISTDDEGISRSNISREYELAVKSFDLDYPTIKTFARNSLTYAFLPGKALWADRAYSKMSKPCDQDVPGVKNPSKSCKVFLEQNEKAALQWDLEKRFIQFEGHVIKG